MTFQLQHVLNYGTRTPAVARTVLQGEPIIRTFRVSAEVCQDAVSVLGELMRVLLRCVDIQEPIENAISAARAQLAAGTLVLRPQPNTIRPPSIVDLENKAASFAQASKLALAQAVSLTKPFYGQDFGHNMHRLGEWAAKQYGSDCLLRQFAHHWEPWVKEVLAIRNAVDHPTDKPRGRLHVRNFFVEEREGDALVDPQWWLEGEDMQPIALGMDCTVSGIIELQEDLLCVIFEGFGPTDTMRLYEVPVDQRPKACPVRLRVDLLEEVKSKIVKSITSGPGGD